MKNYKTLNKAIAILILLVSILSIPQPILAAEGESKSTANLDERQPYISGIYFGARNRVQRLLIQDRITTDVEYSQEYNIIQLTIRHHKDDKNNIELNRGVLEGIILHPLGSSENLIDFNGIDEVELNRGEETSTLTIYTFGLSPNTDYNLRIGEGLVSLNINTDPDDPSVITTLNTEGMGRQFKTRTFPQVDLIITGSVSEDYDVREPITIKGNYFNDIVQVYFNDIPAYDVYLIEDDLLGNYYLKVYLPRGRNKLAAGTYDITVSNGTDHETVLLSAFSVVKEGEYLPNETHRLRDTSRVGSIIEASSTSDTTLNLSSRYSDTISLQIDSDEIFGQSTLIRRIKYTAQRGDVINRLEAKSMWADISLSYIRPAANDRRSDVEIITGRPDPYTTQLLKERLKGINIKSEFINISGSGYSTSSINLSIPYKDGNIAKLKALRYDEAARRWEEEQFYIDEVENRVNIYSYNKGIFVVVEY